MGFHLVPLSSGELERSIQGHTFFQWAVFQTISKIDMWLQLIMNRKSCMRFHLAPFYLFLDDLKRSNQRQIFSMGCISKTVTIKHG